MDLITVKELFKNREEYLDKKVTVGGWIRSIRDSKTFGCIMTRWRISRNSQNRMSELQS